MAFLIDTDLLVDLERGAGNAALENAIGDEERAISVITVSELLHGVHRAAGELRVRRAAFVEHLLGGLRAIEITEHVARVHAELWAQLAGEGKLIGEHDLWIAATAMAHGMAIATGNASEFRRVPGLRVITPPV